MSARVKNWKRIVNVREVQCQAAIGDALAAQRAEAVLQNNAERLRRLCETVHQSDHCRLGADLHAQLELGQRLVQADREISDALSQARQKLAQAERQRTAAYIDREASTKLFEKLRKHIADTAQLKFAQQPQKRARKKGAAA